jgi:hypothetical protein
MSEAMRQCFLRWRMKELLSKYPGLRLRPMVSGYVILAGAFAFSAEGPTKEGIDDLYEIEIAIPKQFPDQLPRVREMNGRIPPSFHKLVDGSLCLGSETRLRLIVMQSPFILSFVELCVIPYLYGYSFFERHGKLPFGELSHGGNGIREDLAELFGIRTDMVADFVRTAALKKGIANKRPCPCGSALRVGRCHHKRINHLRKCLGRQWFRFLYIQVRSG